MQMNSIRHDVQGLDLRTYSLEVTYRSEKQCFTPISYKHGLSVEWACYQQKVGDWQVERNIVWCNKLWFMLFHTGSWVWIWHKHPVCCCWWCNGMWRMILWHNIGSLWTYWALFVFDCLHSRLKHCCWPDAAFHCYNLHFLTKQMPPSAHVTQHQRSAITKNFLKLTFKSPIVTFTYRHNCVVSIFKSSQRMFLRANLNLPLYKTKC